MDRRLSVAVQDSSFGTEWRPGAGRPGEERTKTGRRSFLGRGAAAAAAAMAVIGERTAGRATRIISPVFTPTKTSRSFRPSGRMRTPTFST